MAKRSSDCTWVKGAEKMHMEEIDDGDDELHICYGQCSSDKLEVLSQEQIDVICF